MVCVRAEAGFLASWLIYCLNNVHYTQIQTIRHNPRGLYYPGKSGDFHVTSFHFRVAKKLPQFNECVMNCNVLMYYKCKIMSKYYLFITNYISKYFSALIDVCFYFSIISI